MTHEIDNSQDMIDLRDVIAKFEELESELTEAKNQQSTISKALPLDSWIEESNIEEHPFIDAIEEYLLLKNLLESLKGCGGDENWRDNWYPISLIRDSYFETAMDELLEDIGELKAYDKRPCYIKITIDYNALQMDYSSIDYEGVTYWYR